MLFYTLKKALTCRCHYLIKHILKTPEDSGQPVYMDKIQTSAPVNRTYVYVLESGKNDSGRVLRRET